MGLINLQISFALLFIVVFTTWGGLLIASQKLVWYTPQRLSMFIALGTGMLLAILFSEFLAESFHEHSHLSAALIVTGIVFVIFMETYIAPKISFLEGDRCDHDHAVAHDHKHHLSQEHQHHLISHQAACSAVGCLLVCTFFDGIELKAAFELGESTGWMTSVGLLFHVLPDGALAASIALAGGMSRSAAKVVSVLTGLSMVVGILFTVMLQQIVSFQQFVLPFASGVLMYVTFIHLMIQNCCQ